MTFVNAGELPHEEEKHTIPFTVVHNSTEITGKAMGAALPLSTLFSVAIPGHDFYIEATPREDDSYDWSTSSTDPLAIAIAGKIGETVEKHFAAE